jgi:nucleoside-diphosphate-sugar epimerase
MNLSLDCYKGKTILVTGGRGYIGSMLVNKLSSVDCKIILVDRTGKGWVPLNSVATITSIGIDVSINGSWKGVLGGVDIVFHLAGQEYNRVSFNWRADLENNFLSVALLLESCRSLSVPPRVIFSSSANVTGGGFSPTEAIISEDPLSLWSVHKLMAEKYLRVHALNRQVPSVILRIANVYGPTANISTNENVILNKVIVSALKGNALTLFDNKNLTRDFIHVEDLCNALCSAGIDDNDLLKQGLSFFVGCGESLSFYDIWSLVANEVELIVGKKVKIVFSSKYLEPLDLRCDVEKRHDLSTVSSWHPSYSPEDGIRESVAFFEKFLRGKISQ